MKRERLPQTGCAWEELESRMHAFARNDVDWRHGRNAFHVWYGGDDLFDVQRRAYTMFMQENGGGAGKTFPSLKIMEDAVIDYGAELLRGDDATGHITSGGSESIFVALKAARDWARKHLRGIREPELVVPYSAHPTFNRAGQYLGIRIVRVPVGEDFRADVDAMERAISPATIGLVGSAVCFPYGVIDPIAELGALAQARGLWLHVDACVSGYSAPFGRALGYDTPEFDFSVPGVASISADLHKYGFCAKGTSTILYRNFSLAAYQPFSFADWPLGRFENPNVASTRPGGSIAAAWAVMNYLGRAGYLRLNERLLRLRDRYIEDIGAIDGLAVNGRPHSLIVSWRVTEPERIDAEAIVGFMRQKGWFLGPMVDPPGMLIGLSVPHEAAREDLLADLAWATDEARQGRRPSADALQSAY